MGQSSGVQTPSDADFVAVESVFNQTAAVVTGSALPPHPSAAGDPLEMEIPQRGLSGDLFAEYGRRPGRNDHIDLPIWLVAGDGLITAVAIIRTIGGERPDFAFDPVEQIGNLGGVAGLISRQFGRHQLARFGIQRDMQLTPATTGTAPVFLM